MKYQSEFNEQVYKLALLGATDAQIADFYDVSRSTISNWKNEYPEFLDTLKKGKAQADATIAESLFNRAKGFEYMEQQAIKIKTVEYQDGKRLRETEKVELVEVQRVIPPDTTACIFWLKNRQSDKWRDKVDHEHGSDPNKPVRHSHDVTDKVLKATPQEALENIRAEYPDNA